MAASAGFEARGTSAAEPAETDDSDPQPLHPDLFPRIRDSDRLPQVAPGSLALNQQYATERLAEDIGAAFDQSQRRLDRAA